MLMQFDDFGSPGSIFLNLQITFNLDNIHFVMACAQKISCQVSSTILFGSTLPWLVKI